ncbi:MAG: cytochrome c oxidase subunit II [Proteobacteria bacterium]|nr:cytochrome c oxidase subunit II [Pseudomonadota bacterium]
MNHSALHPAGLHAAQIAHLGWIFLAVSCVVYVVVIGILIVVLVQRRRHGSDPTTLSRAERRALTSVGIAVGITTVLVTCLAVSEFLTRRTLEQDTGEPLRVRIIGHQWWWEVQYQSDTAAGQVQTANELHIPVGRPVQLQMTSQDVIHSFWVPNLQGKRDLIPGHTTHIVLVADQAGRYEGQCAEFCGFQHAKMRIVVDAQRPADFDAWRQAQLQPAREPASEQEKRGKQVFDSGTCVMCHSIQGSPAGGTIGPDLTHVGSRSSIAAGALPNTPQTLALWISNPPAIKPGTTMPAAALSGEDLLSLALYLESLK